VSIRARIFAVIGAVVMAALVQAMVVVYLRNATHDTIVGLDNAGMRFENQVQVGRLLIELESAQRAYLVTRQDRYRDDYERLWAGYERTIALLPQHYAEPDQRDQRDRLADLDAAIREWHENASLVLMNRPATLTDVLTTMDAVNGPRLRNIRNQLDRFESAERDRRTAKSSEFNRNMLRTTLITFAIPAVSIIVLLILVMLLAHILLDPLAAIAQSAQQISGGNFDVQLPPTGRDEIGSLVRAFKDMTAAVQRRQRDLSDALARERESSQMYAALRTKAEQEHARLLATVSTVPAALVIFEASGGRIVLQNRAADELIGHEPDDEDARQTHWAGFRATLRDGTPCPLQDWGPNRALRGEVVVGQELVLTHSSGRRIPVLVSAAPLRDDQGVTTGAVSAFQDITNLYEVDRLKNEFVSVVSHELRTPLTSIKGALQLLTAEATWTDPDQETLVDVALSNTERLIRIINDILDISKIEAGKLELNPRPSDPAHLVRASLQSVEAIAAGASVTIRPVISAHAPHVMADPDRTVQAIVNLLSNALKYAPPGSEVTLGVQVASNGQLGFAVTDRGSGIPADKLGQLFQKFQQLDGVDTRKFRGTGLGLAITKALVEMQGGEVFVESEVGAGSTFAITMPVAG
jgi:signal transduction histidine kinase